MNKLWGIADYLSSAERYNIGSLSLELREKISEGGFAYVYKAIDTVTGQEYAVKKILCQSKELLAMAEREIETMRALPPHENIVAYIGSLMIPQSGYQVALIVMELCTGGSLVNLLEKYNGQLSLSQIFFIVKEICQGIQAVHAAGYVHRDLKIENVLLNNKKFKICDFGSCSREVYELTSASRQQLLTYQELFERETTLMYRPPEMIDLYQRHRIDFKADSWMLGCVVYTLAFCRHPFQDQAQLAIVNAHYSFPGNSRFDEKFHGFISWILNPNPSERPGVNEVYEGICRYESIPEFKSVAVKQQRPAPKRVDRDLTDEEIQREINRIRSGEGNSAKPSANANIWQTPGAKFEPQGGSAGNMGWAKF